MLIKNNLLHLPVSIVLVIKYYYRQAHYHVHKPLFQKRLRSSTTKKLDPETVYYYKARYLDPKTSRWLSGDPAMGEYVPSPGANSGDLPGMGGVYNTVNFHTYHYAGNNPVKYVDLDGRAFNFIAGAIVGAVTSATLNVVGQYLSAQISDIEFKLDFAQVGGAALGGAVAGAVTSGASAVASLTTQPLAQTVMALGGSVAGAAGSTVSTVTENAIKGNNLSQDLKGNVIKGAISGLIGGATTPAPNVSHKVDNLNIINNSTGSTIRREVLREGLFALKDETINYVVDFVNDKINN